MRVIAEVKDDKRPHQAEVEVVPIRNFMVVIDYDGKSGSEGDNQRETIKFENLEKYNWIGIYAKDFQDAEKQLKEKIQKVVGKDGEAANVVLRSHGGFGIDENGNASLDNIGIYTNNNTNSHIQTYHLNDLLRLTIGIPEEEKTREKYFKEREEKREERRLKRQERANARKDKNDKRSKEEKEEEEHNDEEEERKDSRQKENDADRLQMFYDNIKKEKEKLNSNLTQQVKEDISSLLNMINCVKSEGNFVVGSCHSAYSQGFMSNLLQLIEKPTNLIGIEGMGRFSVVTRPGNPEGLVDAEQLWDGEGPPKGHNSLLYRDEEIPDNRALKFSKSSATPDSLKDMLIVHDGLQFINE